MRIPRLYHWAPTRLRVKILQEGLKIYSQQSSSTTNPMTDEEVIVSYPVICLGTSPSAAWGYLLHREAEYDDDREDACGWDLWQVSPSEHDQLSIRTDTPGGGHWISEIRVHNSIPADRVWFVGHRSLLCGLEQPVG